MAKHTTIKTKKLLDQHHKPAINQVTDLKGNTIQLEVQFPYEVRENESGSWVIYSPHFKTFGYSNEGEAQAIQDFKIAIDTFFELHIKCGTLENALIKFGWSKIKNVIQKPKLFNTPLRKGVTRRTFDLRSNGSRVSAIA